MSHIKKKIGIYSFCVLASSVVLAEGSSVVYATKAKTPENYVSESNISETVKYIDGKGQKSVDVINSSSYYMKPNDASEYYGSILGATIYKKGETKHSQYIPIYAIKNANVAKYIKQNEDPNVRKKANERIKEGRETLNKVICDKR